uniref:Uncharacterized protein n=1 Tax=Anguilla anguilla TaxID=7936 RepID=A0A0E9TDD6_ANGAN
MLLYSLQLLLRCQIKGKLGDTFRE